MKSVSSPIASPTEGLPMLPRVLEPEVMDTPEDAHDYDAMDHARVNACFVADFLEAHGPCRGGEILDVGAGTARIPIALCQADMGARILAVDLADAMLAVARAHLERERLTDRIRLLKADAKLLAAEGDSYEGVISNTIVHHIPEPAPVMAAMWNAVAPGGTLFVRDLTRPETRTALDALVEQYAGGESEHARTLFAESLHAALTLDEARAIVVGLGLPSGSVQMTSDRHWTWTATRP